ncbi:ABC transporter permease, partial [Neorhizobium sp. SHOUNA12B]
MISILIRRTLSLAVTLLIVSLLIFTVMDLLPGDPAAIMLGTSASPETLAALQKQLGLDQPLPVRYLAWLAGAFRGDLGQSYTYGVPVAGLIGERLIVTLPLALIAIVLSVSIAIPLGVQAARKHNGVFDFVAGLFSYISIAVPAFWVGLLLIILFSTMLGWMPAGGFPGWDAGLLAGLKALLLPAVALALP